ncbi:MAG: hypothetical protein ACXVYM_00165, partial [Gaiellaceae bacterium]
MLLIALGLALALPGRALAGGPQLLVGAAEDAPKQPTLAAAKAQMTMLHLAGLDAVRMTVQWTTGETELSQGEQDAIANAVEAADLDSIR